MDRLIHPPIDLGRAEEGSRRGRAFEGKSSGGSSYKDAALGRAPSGTLWKDLRQSPRIRCSGSVELRTAGDGAALWGTLTDISLQGCYVEMDNTFAIGTRVYLVLKSLGSRIQTQGMVRTSFPTMGMGISFAEMEPGQQQLLQHLIDRLTGRNPVARFGWERESAARKAMGAGMAIDPIAFLDEITEFFRKKPLLSREEFKQMRERVRRP